MSTVDTSGLNAKLNNLEELKEQIMPKAYKYFKSITPKRSGNARFQTKLNNQYEIETTYPYAERLDNGWSKQAPNGMTKPTEKEIARLVQQYVRKTGA